MKELFSKAADMVVKAAGFGDLISAESDQSEKLGLMKLVTIKTNRRILLFRKKPTYIPCDYYLRDIAPQSPQNPGMSYMETYVVTARPRGVYRAKTKDGCKEVKKWIVTSHIK